MRALLFKRAGFARTVCGVLPEAVPAYLLKSLGVEKKYKQYPFSTSLSDR